MVNSTPEDSMEALHDSDISIIPPQLPQPIIVSDSSADLDLILETCLSHQQLCTRECDVHEQPTMRFETSDQSLPSQNQNTERNNKKMDQTLEQLAKDETRRKLESLDEPNRSGNKSETSIKTAHKSETSERNKSITSEQNEPSQRNKETDLTLEQLAKEEIRRNFESLDDLNRSGNKSEISERKRNKSITSDNKPVMCDNKTSMGSVNKSITSQVENWLRTTNIDAASQNTQKKCLCWKKSVQIQIPQKVHKSDCCDVIEEEIASLQSQKTDCNNVIDFAAGTKIEKAQKSVKIGEDMSFLQAQRFDGGIDKDSAKVLETKKAQKSVKIEEGLCDCGITEESDRVRETKKAKENVKIEEGISDCGSAKESARVQETKKAQKSVKIEQGVCDYGSAEASARVRETKKAQTNFKIEKGICDCGSAKESARVQETKKAQKSVIIEEGVCDCGSAKESARVRGTTKAQTNVKIEDDICDCGSAKESARIQETKKAQTNAKIEADMLSQQSQICDCASDKDSTRVQKHEKVLRSVKVEEQSLVNDAELNLKPCPCNKLECLKKEETRIQADEEKADAGTSENEEDSGGGSSCAGACEQYYRNKLMSTLQILQNKEETIRVQGSSLGVAEARIAALTERACALRCELDQKATELNKLRKFAESCRVEKADISITAEMQEVETQKNIVNTLQDNLSVIAELYRECFFETAKQEELIDMLRKSYLDVRLMDKDKSDKINRLQNVINTQKWSIEQCQDVVVEVENLKSEISNFLNNSNNDSGMWERGSESPDVGEELGDILDQLRQLQDMLTGDCTCGLEEENKALRKKNEHLEMQVDKLRHRVSELEGTVLSSHSLGQQYQKQIEEKEQEFHEVRQKLIEIESANEERGATCETLSRQLQQSQVLLDDKIVELAEAQRSRAAQESAVMALKQELDQADAVIKEGLRKLMEASQWRAQLDESRARVEELERQLQTVCTQCRDLEMCCREKEHNASTLQGQLEEAHARGAALCDESRRVTACVRQWMCRQRALAREQQEKIRTQESMLNELQRCVEARQYHSVRTSQSEIAPCCSKSATRLHPCASGTTYTCSRPHLSAGGSETAFSSCLPIPSTVDRESEMPSCSQCASNRQGRRERSSESEMASCSSAPVPPRRRKKMPPCGDNHCPWSPNPHIRFASLPRQVSPTDEIIEHVEHLHAALAATQRRWARPRR